MSTGPIEKRLSNISTNWDELIAAHDGERFDPTAAALRGDVLRRYADCVYQYILGATRSQHTAEDLAQEFALRFVRGDFRNASPQRGRFRDYLKTSLRNSITDHFRSKASEKHLETRLASEQQERIESLEDTFARQWRERVLSITWKSLKSFDAKNNQYYAVLRLRAEYPKATSDELAMLFSYSDGRTVKSDWIRQTLRRARAKFAELLIEEVGKTLNTTDKTEIAEEMASLGLQKYVRDDD